MLICGIDEAGRGPLAGNVFAAAVILNTDDVIPGLDDSKKLSEKKREALFSVIKDQAVAWAVSEATVDEIDKMNILQASLLAMKRAFDKIRHISCKEIYVDGSCCPQLASPCSAVVGGDSLIPAVSAASILAKVSRDRYCSDLHQLYPQYNFIQHKGYPTQQHFVLLDKYGPSPVHRRSFAPVKRCLHKLSC
ncbi:ribonuclease HII [Candidatus Ichthyocystis hellenicum]|uniref:ribonuclease HII n=1 Tax=Candidatus Ichthyocystis hellenicum TaxID=1561003 RepID=UPI000B333610|nr:ribonuclease HII [Candidatus Ichthyocystis hellenicum]